MTDELNPYQTPPSLDEQPSWWSRVRSLFSGVQDTQTRYFAGGDAIICDGISFFLDPDNPDVVYAASPSAEHTEKRLNLIVSEAIRVLPAFLDDYPELHSLLRGRKLTVRMIDSYCDRQSMFRSQVTLEWDILNALLSDDSEES